MQTLTAILQHLLPGLWQDDGTLPHPTGDPDKRTCVPRVQVMYRLWHISFLHFGCVSADRHETVCAPGLLGVGEGGLLHHSSASHQPQGGTRNLGPSFS